MKRLAAACLALAACGHSRAPVATAADAQRAGVSLEELDHGRSLFVGHCGTCHLPPRPSSFPPEAWPGHVSEMRERAGLTFEDETLIQRYLVTMASKD